MANHERVRVVTEEEEAEFRELYPPRAHRNDKHCPVNEPGASTNWCSRPPGHEGLHANYKATLSTIQRVWVRAPTD